MTKDIRISVGFFDHPKTIKLHRRCGAEGVLSLQRLWAWAATDRPSGDLTGMDREDIAIAAKWVGDIDVFFDAIKGRFLDVDDEGGIFLHDWKENNSWVAGSTRRADVGRFNRMKKEFPREHQILLDGGISSINTEDYLAIKEANNKERLSITQALLKQCSSTTQENTSSAPTPGPTPAPAPAPAPAPNPKNLTETTTTTRAEIGKLYCQTFERTTVPAIMWPKIDKVAEAYPIEVIREAFEKMAGSKGKTWEYLFGILEGIKNGTDNGHRTARSKPEAIGKASGILPPATGAKVDWAGDFKTDW